MKFFYYKCRPINYKLPIVAWLIMIFQGMAPWNKKSTSHRALGYFCPKGLPMVIDSTGKEGVSTQSLKDFELKYKMVESQEIDLKIDCTKFYSWIKEHNNLKYGHLQVLGLMLKQLFGFITFNSVGKNFNSLTCNELIVKFALDFNLINKSLIKDSDNFDLLMTDQLVDTLKQR